MMIPSLYDLVHDNICKKELIIEPQVLARQRREKRQRFNTYICLLMDECDFDLLVILRETNHFIRNKKNVCIPLYIFFMMVNNSTNINKTINYLSPQLIEHEKKDVGNPGPGYCLGQAQKCGRF